MRAGAFGLRQGRILLMFPEGERSIDGTVKRFKKGVPTLSRELGAPIIPVAIHGVFELWPRNRPFNWRLLRGCRHQVRVVFGEAMQVPRASDPGAAAIQLQHRVASLWRDAAASPQHGGKHSGRNETTGEHHH
jgi:1-acyl-sn-glycerol-3-phosphate acyltransferase